MEWGTIIPALISGGFVTSILTYVVTNRKNSSDFLISSIEKSQAVNDALIKNLNAEYEKLRERIAILEKENAELKAKLNN